MEDLKAWLGPAGVAVVFTIITQVVWRCIDNMSKRVGELEKKAHDLEERALICETDRNRLRAKILKIYAQLAKRGIVLENDDDDV